MEWYGRGPGGEGPQVCCDAPLSGCAWIVGTTLCVAATRCTGCARSSASLERRGGPVLSLFSHFLLSTHEGTPCEVESRHLAVQACSFGGGARYVLMWSMCSTPLPRGARGRSSRTRRGRPARRCAGVLHCCRLQLRAAPHAMPRLAMTETEVKGHGLGGWALQFWGNMIMMVAMRRVLQAVPKCSHSVNSAFEPRATQPHFRYLL